MAPRLAFTPALAPVLRAATWSAMLLVVVVVVGARGVARAAEADLLPGSDPTPPTAAQLPSTRSLTETLLNHRSLVITITHRHPEAGFDLLGQRLTDLLNRPDAAAVLAEAYADRCRSASSPLPIADADRGHQRIQEAFLGKLLLRDAIQTALTAEQKESLVRTALARMAAMRSQASGVAYADEAQPLRIALKLIWKFDLTVTAPDGFHLDRSVVSSEVKQLLRSDLDFIPDGLLQHFAPIAARFSRTAQ
ncbi:MAG: hypothetical protein IT580_14595 [Verrucomicrobiales bacterium]|nr:hypothetical protein [Verrucomicrobiales bacterium]